MLNVGGSFDINEPTTLLLMPGLAAYADAVVIAIGLYILTRRDNVSASPAHDADVDLLAAARTKEQRDLLIITLVPLLVLFIAPGLLVIHPAVTIAALTVFLLIASLVFRQMLRVVSGTA